MTGSTTRTRLRQAYGGQATTRTRTIEEGVDVARLAREIIAGTRAGAAVDMREHTRVMPMREPSGGAMTEERAAKMARENKALAGM